MSGAPVRWHFMTLFGIAVCAGVGAAAVHNRFRNRRIGKVPLGPFVKRFPLDDINDVFEKAHNREILERPVMVP